MHRSSFESPLASESVFSPAGPGSGPPAPTSLAMRARWTLEAHRANIDGTDAKVVRLPDDAAIELVRQMATEVKSQVQQIIPLSSATLPTPSASGAPLSWRFAPNRTSITSFSHAVSRSLAAQKLDIERIYLVPPGGLHANLVNWQIAEDGKARITSRSLPVSWLDSDTSARVPVSLVWIVDGSTVLSQELGEDGPPVWAVSEREDDVSRAERLWKNLWALASSHLNTDAADFLTEPLLVSAEQIAAAAPMTCANGYDTRHRCDWYHGAWQYLRLFDMVSSPSWHKEFYRRTLVARLDAHMTRKTSEAKPKPVAAARPAAPDGGERSAERLKVLITGAADYSMLAYVIDAWKHTQAAKDGVQEAPSINVLDICPTPLLACRWYTRNVVKYPIQTHELDLRDKSSVRQLLRADGPFDLIVTDAFLTRFDHKGGRAVLNHWWQLLAPNGSVVTTIRLHPEDGPDDEPDEAVEFAKRAREAARRWKLLLRSSVDAIGDDAREYAHRITSTDFGNLEEVIDLFDHARFEVLEYEVSDRLPGELQSTKYVRVVARKTVGLQSVTVPEPLPTATVAGP